MARSSINGGEGDWKAELSQMVEQIKEVRSHGSSPQTEAGMMRRLSHDGQETAAAKSIINDMDRLSSPVPLVANTLRLLNSTPKLGHLLVGILLITY